MWLVLNPMNIIPRGHQTPRYRFIALIGRNLLAYTMQKYNVWDEDPFTIGAISMEQNMTAYVSLTCFQHLKLARCSWK